MSPDIDNFKVRAFGDAGEKTRWSVHRLGVKPEYQRQGVGSRLVQHICAKVSLARSSSMCYSVTHVMAFFKASGYNVTSQATDGRGVSLVSSLLGRARFVLCMDSFGSQIQLYSHLGFKTRASVQIEAPHGKFTLTALMWCSPAPA